jgi:hypothetical protein
MRVEAPRQFGEFGGPFSGKGSGQFARANLAWRPLAARASGTVMTAHQEQARSAG